MKFVIEKLNDNLLNIQIAHEIEESRKLCLFISLLKAQKIVKETRRHLKIYPKKTGYQMKA